MGRELIEVAWYPLLSLAHERSLVLHALGMPVWVIDRDDGFGIYVEPIHASDAAAEIARFEWETEKPGLLPVEPSRKLDPVPLFLFGWIAAAFMIAQRVGAESWIGSGTASSRAIVTGGEFWRVFTALTLHADLPHFLANLATGILFGAFLVPMAGGGLTWLGFVLAGGLGNLVNAWCYRETDHLSIGGSTGVFALLGMLVALQTATRLRRGRVRFWEVVLPIGAGLALLAYLGTGGGPTPEGQIDPKTDLLAHLWGFLAGLGVGGLIAGLRLPDRMGRTGQIVSGACGLAVLVGAWLAAG